MKKLIVIAFVIGGLLSAKAATITTVIPVGGCSNLLSGVGYLPKVTQVLLTATTGTNTSVKLIDSPDTNSVYTIDAYVTQVSLLTNWVTSVTNYWGATESITNNGALYTQNYTNAAVTNAYTIIANPAAAASTTLTIDNANIRPQYGLWATNTSSGTASVTLTYTQP